MANHHDAYLPPRLSSGWDRFNEFYAKVWGRRWLALRDALEAPVRHVALLNPWSPEPPEGLEGLEQARPVDGIPGCLEMPPERMFPSPDALGLEPYPYYLLDGASVMTARALQVEPGCEVLDLCAAPGGKSFALAMGLGSGGRLVSNDIDDERRVSLQSVLRCYLPDEVRARTSLTARDATRWSAHERDAYDRVLVDAPCSSERHLLLQGTTMERWSQWRSEELARTQYAMLSAALDVVRPGGRVVYSTCSISPMENDGVLERLMQRRGDQVELATPSLTWGEPTRYGWQVLPDVTHWGPMYVATLERTQ